MGEKRYSAEELQKLVEDVTAEELQKLAKGLAVDVHQRLVKTLLARASEGEQISDLAIPYHCTGEEFKCSTKKGYGCTSYGVHSCKGIFTCAGAAFKSPSYF